MQHIDIMRHECEGGFCSREGCCGGRISTSKTLRQSSEEKRRDEEQRNELERYLIKPIALHTRTK